MASVVFDLRDAFRSLRRDRSYAATVIVTLALTIGATTAVFSIVDGVLLRFVAPGFFRTIGVPVLRGRSFLDNERDRGRPAPSVISERTAAVLWPGRDPLGQRFSRGEADEQGFEVVGVVADAHTTSIERTPPLMVYAPYWWRSRPTTG
jgi:hypothetical protein